MCLCIRHLGTKMYPKCKSRIFALTFGINPGLQNTGFKVFTETFRNEPLNKQYLCADQLNPIYISKHKNSYNSVSCIDTVLKLEFWLLRVTHDIFSIMKDIS